MKQGSLSWVFLNKLKGQDLEEFVDSIETILESFGVEKLKIELAGGDSLYQIPDKGGIVGRYLDDFVVDLPEGRIKPNGMLFFLGVPEYISDSIKERTSLEGYQCTIEEFYAKQSNN